MLPAASKLQSRETDSEISTQHRSCGGGSVTAALSPPPRILSCDISRAGRLEEKGGSIQHEKNQSMANKALQQSVGLDWGASAHDLRVCSSRLGRSLARELEAAAAAAAASALPSRHPSTADAWWPFDVSPPGHGFTVRRRRRPRDMG